MSVTFCHMQKIRRNAGDHARPETVLVLFYDELSRPIMTVSNLDQIVKMQVVDILTIDLYPLISHQRKHRFLPRHFIVPKLRRPLFLLRHDTPSRKSLQTFSIKECGLPDRQLIPKQGLGLDFLPLYAVQ